ncbi:MAG: ferritin-like domain-containing protein [Pseudomonadota bacterium]
MISNLWKPDDISWSAFEPDKVDGELLKIIKAASMVEYNGADYATYLCNVFADDEAFMAAAKAWSVEEVQHGEVLARWAKMADPSFDFEAAFKSFTDGYQIPLEASASVRGSRSGELVARCIVEVGTSSYYSALGEATDEPVLKEICQRIAADEMRHYKLFYDYLRGYLERENIGRWRRVMVALGRIGESEDDELAYAYYAANADGEAYERKRWSRAYMSRAYGYYRPKHVRRAVSMTFKAAGLNPQGRLSRWVADLGYRFMKFRAAKAVAA